MSGMTTPSYQTDFLPSTLGITLEFLSDILLDILTLEEFDPAKEFHWNRRVSQLTSDISQFVEITTLLARTIRIQKKINLEEMKASHISLLFIMKAMNQAQQKQDYLALEELIKYELKDNLTQWKIDLIPQTKKLLNT